MLSSDFSEAKSMFEYAVEVSFITLCPRGSAMVAAAHKARSQKNRRHGTGSHHSVIFD